MELFTEIKLREKGLKQTSIDTSDIQHSFSTEPQNSFARACVPLHMERIKTWRFEKRHVIRYCFQPFVLERVSNQDKGRIF